MQLDRKGKEVNDALCCALWRQEASASGREIALERTASGEPLGVGKKHTIAAEMETPDTLSTLQPPMSGEDGWHNSWTRRGEGCSKILLFFRS